ncbi:hypothetical protein FKK32_29790 [Klebsiella pneumoniae]|nr:hypothetical protein [Klebsiella pneumoniae]
MRFPDDVRELRVVHLDRYTGVVLADIGLKDYGAVGRLTEWGISLHTGRQFGLLNQLLMLAGCLSIVLLAVSSVVGTRMRSSSCTTGCVNIISAVWAWFHAKVSRPGPLYRPASIDTQRLYSGFQWPW